MLICYSSFACLSCLLLIHVWLYYARFIYYQDVTISFYSLNRIMAAWWHFQNSVHHERYPRTRHHSAWHLRPWKVWTINASKPTRKIEISKTTITGHLLQNAQEPFRRRLSAWIQSTRLLSIRPAAEPGSGSAPRRRLPRCLSAPRTPAPSARGRGCRNAPRSSPGDGEFLKSRYSFSSGHSWGHRCTMTSFLFFPPWCWRKTKGQWWDFLFGLGY